MAQENEGAVSEEELECISGGGKALCMGAADKEEQDIRQGDIVMLLPAATFYDGRIIPQWMKQEQWIVCRVDGDRIVIDWNLERNLRNPAPVHRKNLRKV